MASVEGAWALSPALHARAGLARTVLAPLGVSVLSPDDNLTLCLGTASPRPALREQRGLPSYPSLRFLGNRTQSAPDGRSGKSNTWEREGGGQVEEPAVLLIMITDAPFSCFLQS